ncbi:MAG: hypothetical protein LBB45_02600 [Methanobrevibacter sp.]|nr:hypothetical protein [Candidatus Methanovirga basalitermitum]
MVPVNKEKTPLFYNEILKVFKNKGDDLDFEINHVMTKLRGCTSYEFWL